MIYSSKKYTFCVGYEVIFKIQSEYVQGSAKRLQAGCVSAASKLRQKY